MWYITRCRINCKGSKGHKFEWNHTQLKFRPGTFDKNDQVSVLAFVFCHETDSWRIFLNCSWLEFELCMIPRDYILNSGLVPDKGSKNGRVYSRQLFQMRCQTHRYSCNKNPQFNGTARQNIVAQRSGKSFCYSLYACVRICAHPWIQFTSNSKQVCTTLEKKNWNLCNM